MAKPKQDDIISQFHDYSIYLPSRIIYMGSEESNIEHGESGCDSAMAERVIKNLRILDHLNKEPITIIMNNIGGDEYHCFAMYDAIQACKSYIKIEVFGHAMSAGSIILQAADERIMAPNSRQMLHYGTWGIHDHAKTATKWAIEGEKINTWMEKMYLAKIHEKNPSFTLKKIKNILDHDTFLTAEESVEIGLADKVFNNEE